MDNEVYDAYTMEDLSFHNTIALSCGNEYLYRSYNQLFPSIVDISRLGETAAARSMLLFSCQPLLSGAKPAGFSPDVRRHRCAPFPLFLPEVFRPDRMAYAATR